MSENNEIKITSGNFEKEVIMSDIPVLIDFWAAWCAPCRMLAPIIGQLSDEYAGRVKIGKVNVDEEAELSGKFRIMSIPTVILFKGGGIYADKTGSGSEARIIGVRSKNEYTTLLDRSLV